MLTIKITQKNPIGPTALFYKMDCLAYFECSKCLDRPTNPKFFGNKYKCIRAFRWKRTKWKVVRTNKITEENVFFQKNRKITNYNHDKCQVQ